MTSQMEGDKALAEHRAVMAALMKACISRPTQEQYDRTLYLVSEALKCPETTTPLSSLPCLAHSLSEF
jgi:hypothetical protein